MVKLTPQLQFLKPILPQRLVQYNCRGIGQVQGTDVAPHGNPDTVVLIVHQYLLRDAGAFLAEHEVAVRPVGHIGIHFMGFGGSNYCNSINYESVFKYSGSFKLHGRGN